MAKVGFIGLGVMGSQMVNRLLSKGHTDDQPTAPAHRAEWLIKKGMQWADSPRAVASAADYTFAMVTNAAAIQAIAEGPDGLLAGLTAGRIFIDMSTVSPTVSRALAAKVRSAGADMVDSPVSGSVITLQEGKIVGDGWRSQRNFSTRSSRCCSISAPRSRTSATTAWRSP